MELLRAVRATESVRHLAEGPGWDAERQCATWVDIESGTLWRAQLSDQGLGPPEIVHRSDLPLGFAIQGRGADWIIPHGGTLTTIGGSVSSPLFSDPCRRFNDAIADAAGRVIAGTLHRDPVPDPPNEVLARLEPDGNWSVLRAGLTLANGLSFSQDGATLFHVDGTMSRVVASSDYKNNGPWSTAFAVDNGYPDGMCADADGLLWVAIWGAGEVRRYDPDGTILTRVQIPAPNVSSVAFVGAMLDTLLITTARQDLDHTELARWPDSGALSFADPNVAGVPQHRAGARTGRGS